MATHHVRALVQIREMILRGDLRAGERLTEESLAERLGMSRTPIRQALPALAREGLLVVGETRGYIVRTFSARDVSDAIDLRGVLEGVAGRMVAERGAPPSLLRALRDCLDAGDVIFDRQEFADGDETRYAEINSEFHTLIVTAAGSKILSDALSANDRIPFAAAAAVAFDRMPADFMFDLLRFAHRQHCMIVQALEARQGARVEALLREHAQPVKDSLNLRHQVYDNLQYDGASAGVRPTMGLPL
jgi:GntR family transcriptional regulator of vanillate catabolism